MKRNPDLSTSRRLLPLSLLALASAAQAGRWVTTCSGGRFHPIGTPASFARPMTASGGRYGSPSGFGYDWEGGSITVTPTWIGDYPGDYSMPPPYVCVREQSSAVGTTRGSDGPEPTADDGIGSKPVTNPSSSFDTPGTAVTASGIRIEKHAVNSGVVQFTVSPYATGRTAAVVGYSASVTEYAVGIASDRNVTYRKGAGGIRTANDLSVLTPRFGDTAVQYWYALDFSGNITSEGYRCHPRFDRVLIGGTDAFNQWSCPPETWQDGPLSENTWISPLWNYSEKDVLGWVNGGGPSKVVTLKVTDDNLSNLTATGTYTMRLHAPAENIVESPKVQEFGSEKLAWGPMGPNGFDVRISQSVSISSTTSKTIKFGLEGSGTFDIKLVEASLKANYGVEWGKSATVSRTISVDFTIPAGHSAFIVGRPTWKAWTVSWDAYDVNGYAGPASSRATSWISGTAPSAEANLSSDFLWRVIDGRNTADYL